MTCSISVHIDQEKGIDTEYPKKDFEDWINEVEHEYQASIDFIRFIDDIDSGDLYEESTWQQLATLEAILVENQDQMALFPGKKQTKLEFLKSKT